MNFEFNLADVGADRLALDPKKGAAKYYRRLPCLVAGQLQSWLKGRDWMISVTVDRNGDIHEPRITSRSQGCGQAYEPTPSFLKIPDGVTQEAKGLVLRLEMAVEKSRAMAGDGGNKQTPSPAAS